MIFGKHAISALPALRTAILEPRNKSKKGIFFSAISALEKIQAEKPVATSPPPEVVPVIDEDIEETSIVETHEEQKELSSNI